MAQGLLDCPVEPGNDSDWGIAWALRVGKGLDSGFALARAPE
jgi:hypothetical protein